MFAVVQFPIADARRFVPDRKLRLGKPAFPNPRTHAEAEFIKYLGPAARRSRDRDLDYADELYYCRADRSVLFSDLHRQRIKVESSLVPVSCRFRRLFSDGKVVSRLEIGLSSREEATPLTGLSGEQCVDLITGLMSLHSRVRTQESPAPWSSRDDYFLPKQPASLISNGRRIARLYASATTNPKLPAEQRADGADFVIDAPPLILLEFEGPEVAAFPKEARIVDPALVEGAHIGFVNVTLSGTRFGAWLLHRDQASYDAMRRLRLCILRLNAERQVLDQIINLYEQDVIAFTPRTSAGDELEAYILRSISLIQRPERHAIDQSAILAAFDAAGFAMPAADLKGLAERYEGMRRQIRAGLLRYQESREVNKTSIGTLSIQEVQVISNSNVATGTGNVINLGDGDVNNTVTINESAANDVDLGQLRAQLDALYEAIGASGLPAEVKQEAQAATFQAKKEGMKDGKIDAGRLVGNLETVGQALEGANDAIEEGGSLWTSIKNLATTVSPIVVGGLKLATLVI